MSRLIPAVVLASGLLAFGAASAAPPAPVGSVEPERMMGRWYEILRAPNKVQINCFAAYQVWSRQGPAYSIQQICHRDNDNGQVAQVGALAKPLNSENTLYDASFLGGLVHRQYAVIDHAPDYSWVISTTADGRFPKLLSRNPSMSSAEQETLKQHMARQGFDVSRLVPCGGTATASGRSAPAG